MQGLKQWPGNRETDRETDRERQTERQTERERRTFKHRESAEQQRMCVCECVWSLMFVLAQLLLPHLRRDGHRESFLVHSADVHGDSVAILCWRCVPLLLSLGWLHRASHRQGERKTCCCLLCVVCRRKMEREKNTHARHISFLAPAHTSSSHKQTNTHTHTHAYSFARWK